MRQNEATLTQSVANVAAAKATDQTAGRWMQVPAVQVASLTTAAISVESKATGGLFIAADASSSRRRATAQAAAWALAPVPPPAARQTGRHFARPAELYPIGGNAMAPAGAKAIAGS